ncbi:histidine phosphatase family protein [Aquabacterium sp. A7-Y]|uniref:histidine phosphatase family protein n=1 Tax=Aquabacterium sp. A7-Y TaxID=1349605 RepID=UPI00223D0FDC|nr:histidine phosphatase family protein [Aquabacterium sp. A7-Y]MCW7539859.1 histidine phosphatase family protein [Aquabacterium sp. A7-Y]
MPHRDLTRVIAIRHGETAWNADSRIQGHLDIPLNDKGLWQAERLAEALADEHIDAIYSSDLTRAHQTAQAVAATRGLSIERDAGLRERGFGEFQGQSFREIEARWPEQALRWRRRDPAFGPAGGEALQVFYDRVVTTASRIAARHPGQNIALVAHGGVLDCLYRAATRVDLQAARTWELGNASINRLLYTGEGFMLVGWADTSHLNETSLDENSDGDRVGSAA